MHINKEQIALSKKNWLVLSLAASIMLMLNACGGSSTPTNSQLPLTLSGNWQFTVANPPDQSFLGGLQGGFLLQSGGTVSGGVVYSVSLPGNSTPCNSGSAPITGTISGQTVNLTAVAGPQTFALTGMLSTDGTTMVGTYTSTVPDGSTCGTNQTAGLQWSALFVPPITGGFQGSFHSTEFGTSLTNQDFAVVGALTQGENIGASNATVTGSLSFLNPSTNISDYPCFNVANVNGQISGNSVILQIIGVDGSTLGQIGEPAGSVGNTGVNPVTFDSVQGGYVLHGTGPSYLVASKTCPGNLGGASTAGDSGNICLSLTGGLLLGNSKACQMPLTLSPAMLIFPSQLLSAPSTTQTVTLTNNTNSEQDNLTLRFTNNGVYQFGGESDFNGLPSFIETDNCGAGGASTSGQPFDLIAEQVCTVTVTFSPQESCPWIPFGTPPSSAGAAPEWCPLPAQGVQLTLKNPNNSGPDSDASIAVPVTGIGLSLIQPSAPELDFGAEEAVNPKEASLPQMLSFTNTSNIPVQILGAAPCTNLSPTSHNSLPHPLLATSPVAGLQVVSNGSGNIPITADGSTIDYRCDSDPVTGLADFQISADTCTGTLLAAQATCSLQIAYVPQPNTNVGNGLDYFLELNTVQCSGAVTTDCEIDSGRFPVELRANPPSPLRMSPGAGLNFGTQAEGKASAPMTITLLNDPTLANPQTVTFVGKPVAQGNYSETDDCSATLAPGSSCTLTITFKPSIVGFDPGTLTINYSPEPLGIPQIVYLRGTGQ